MQLFTKDAPLETLQQDGSFRGYAATYGKLDRAGEIIEPGAASWSNEQWPVLWNHDPNRPIGINKSAINDNVGLAVESQLFEGISDAATARSWLLGLQGVKQQGKLSIGYYVKDAVTESSGIRRLKSIIVREHSVVIFPANPEAVVTEAKNAEPATIRAAEQALMGAGLSAREAKSVLASGWKAAFAEVNADQKALQDLHFLLALNAAS